MFECLLGVATLPEPALGLLLGILRKLRRQRMASEITIKGQKAKVGERMTGGSGWRLATTKGKKRVFVASLMKTFNFGNKRLALFSVPK
jgi:hypothetical protein